MYTLHLNEQIFNCAHSWMVDEEASYGTHFNNYYNEYGLCLFVKVHIHYK